MLQRFVALKVVIANCLVQRLRTVKTAIGLISKKATFDMQHTFFYISLPLFSMTTTWNFQKLPGYTFYGGNVVRVLVPFFFPLPLILSLNWWPLAFPFSHHRRKQKLYAVLSTKKCLLCFLFLALDLSPFFSLSFAGLPPTFSFSLSFSCSYSRFVDMTINLSLII